MLYWRFTWVSINVLPSSLTLIPRSCHAKENPVVHLLTGKNGIPDRCRLPELRQWYKIWQRAQLKQTCLNHSRYIDERELSSSQRHFSDQIADSKLEAALMLCNAPFESFNYRHGGGVRSFADLTLSAHMAVSSTT